MREEFPGSNVADGNFGAANIVAQKLPSPRDYANGNGS
jgi:hypothetical protein